MGQANNFCSGVSNTRTACLRDYTNIVSIGQLAMYFSKSMTKSSLAKIGMHCGGKDHATVLHACRTVNNLIDTDKQFKTYVTDLQKKISIE